MKKIIILIDDGFEDSEFIYPYYRLQEAGYEVKIVGAKAKESYHGKYGVPYRTDFSPDQVKIDDYVAVVIPGGRAPDSMRINKGLVELVKSAFKKGKVIAAICHAAQMLIEADVIRGKRATCWYSVATDLKNAGGIYEDSPVVVDGKLVTSRMPADLPQFCSKTIEVLESQQP
ncbi:MAG: type 1 glutamine amidotransferase domain-containing protein [Candidatus Freyarchaeum deiterrae]